MKKPSERIEELHLKMSPKVNMGEFNVVLARRIQAIQDYLDEEWEKNHPCKHEMDDEIREYENGVFFKQCKKCPAIEVIGHEKR